MNKKKKSNAARIIVVFLVLFSIPNSKVRSTAAPNPDQTILEVRQAGAQPAWGTSRTIHALHVLTFRWKTDVPMTNFGQWQLLDYPPPPQDLMAQPFATSNVGPPAPTGQFENFTIDFAAIQQQNPGKIPSTAPAQPKDYYLRLVPWKTMDMTDPNNVAGTISINVKITYVKSPPPPANPLSLDYVFDFTGGHYVDISYGANKPVVPIVSVSLKPPDKNAQGNPVFKGKIVGASVPFLSGYERDGEVELRGLTPKTHYHYIVEVKDEKGDKAYKTGQFTTATRYVEVAFQKIFMIDDSDGFPSGAGDLRFGFFVNTTNALGPSKTFPQNKNMDFPTGETKTFNVFKTLEDPPDTMTVRVNGSDQDDCGDVLHHPLCNCANGIGDRGSITDANMPNFTCKDGSGEFSAATKTVKIPDVTDRSRFGVEFFQETFTMTADNGNLKFRVTGSI